MPEHPRARTMPEETGSHDDCQANPGRANPLTQALCAVHDLGVRVPPTDMVIACMGHNCVVRVADHSSAHREVIEGAFPRRVPGGRMGSEPALGGDLTMQHPVGLTRLPTGKADRSTHTAR